MVGRGSFEGDLTGMNEIRDNFRDRGIHSETVLVPGAHDGMTASHLFTIFAKDYLWTANEDDKPAEDRKPGEDGKLDDLDKNGQKLPKTATGVYNIFFIGLLILLLGVGIIFYQRKLVK